jgi:uncharacterized protein (DUF1778 family)
LTKLADATTSKAEMARLYLRMPADVKATIWRAANLSGCSLGEFVVTSALAAAEKTIREREVIDLSENDSITFLEAILNPKGPNEALLRAARRHRELFGSF